jgi:hypothetical protein
MLAKAYLITVFVVLAFNKDCLLVHLLVQVEQVLGHHVQVMLKASCFSCVLVMNCTKRERLVFDARVMSCLEWLEKVVSALSGDLGYAWYQNGCGKWSL